MNSATVLNLAVSQRSTMYNLLREPILFPTGEITTRLIDGAFGTEPSYF